jgi:predicted transcriptional regulator
MSSSTIKTDLHKVIDSIEDEELLEEIHYLIKSSLEGNQEEMWDELPEEVKIGIEEGLSQANKGQTITNEQFREKFKKWFSK